MAAAKVLLTKCEWCGGPMPTTGRFRRFCSHGCSHKSWVQAHPEQSRAIQKKYEDTHQDQIIARQREYQSQPSIKSQIRNTSLKRRYGLTPDTYNKLLVAQNSVCAICGKTPEENGRALAVDHDRACCSGRDTCGECIRGLLCIQCNQRLGIIENIEWMGLANNYLKQYQ